jgi:CRP-like cAMP-binding protein
MQALRALFEQSTSAQLTAADFAAIAEAFTSKKLRRKQFLLQEGDVCRHFAFVVQGSLRQYSTDEQGGEHITQFAVENNWVGDRESWMLLTPSPYNVDVLEDCELLLVTYSQLQLLVKAVPAVAMLMWELDQHYFIATQKRLHSFVTGTAEERYAALACQHPDYVKRFPQHMIASYLGIAPETLCRRRARPLAKKIPLPVKQGIYLNKQLA